jgi:ADP-ribosylglycohydrolase
MNPASVADIHPVVSSALWAAWGDALGFITELTTSISEVSRRSGGAKVENTVPWSRRIGGRFGPMVELPAGTYSDDTQLRLAVSRSIRANRRFDFEAFSKIELPVFLSYEMRGGRGTKAAAYALMKRHIRWSSNFFDDRSRYVEAGGNGAAMRIQPHVWSAPGFDPRNFMNYVVADAIITHGHPRGVVGAVIHANALSSVLRHGQIPRPDVWAQIVDYAHAIPETMLAHEALRERWLPTWEQMAGQSWPEAVAATISEGKEMIAAAQAAAHESDPAAAYSRVLTSLGGKKRETVGSGMIAAVASLLGAWCFRDDPAAGLRVIVNELGSDTDTIASLAGALLGATGLPVPPGPVLDDAYIVAEAERMLAIAEGRDATNFPHPDPLRWTPPRTLADAVGTMPGGGLAIAGLGPVTGTDGEYPLDRRDSSLYQWMTLYYGQTVLVRRRREPRVLAATELPLERSVRTQGNGNGQVSLFDQPARVPDGDGDTQEPPGQPDLDQSLRSVIAANFDECVIGRELLRFARLQNRSLERASEFAVAVAVADQNRGGTRRAP